MSDHEAVPLLKLPLEVRHNIFEYVAARDIKPKKLLRNWFEKKEAKELVAKETAANPNGPAPRVVQARDYDDESDLGEQEDDDDAGEGEEEASDEEDEDDGGEEDDDEDEENDEEDGNEPEGEQIEDDQAEELDDEQQEVGDHDAAVDLLAMNASTQTQAAAEPQATITVMTETEIAEDDIEMTDAEAAQDEAEPTDEEHENVLNMDGEEVEELDEDAEGGEEDGEDEQAAPPAPPPQQPVTIHVAAKWRHIPRFMRITRCPPPTSLLLISKQIHDDAKSWFYDVAILRIEATGSFAHTSFFEEAFSQITDAAFSPMENIRKVEVTFVWDTTWIRSDTTGCVEAIFPALLRQRANFVHQILSRAPDLKEVTVHWHDSAQDDESMNLMIDVLAPFHTLTAKVVVVEHYIAADAKPHKRSIAGKRRVEFQHIADMGLDRLF